ncbi:RecB-like helicase [Campylobacter ureolyticus]|uniref:DNA 3'-5' helicase n=1 Tax=Campylobacter ureolyticus TaxID=827 RepID=A0AAE7E9F3_9BACT|nr:RecB-like helicase [Campylobacter ureolyticus]MCR8684658.1 RecB-like helicase [Campylobacter ureolyticus]QKF84052.1 AddAB recombination complex, helicase AddA [Campylobacter ureolyticus]QQY35802.1 RecB-like helicase [Campylobacter ureolyticus]SUX24161.1 recombination protein RecB [Campylobacter ureolyticus]
MSDFKTYEALSASAGSGKTFALSIRYLVLIFKGVMPNKILALTFTRKAAAEMENRIIETFLGLKKYSPNTPSKERKFEAEKEELLNILNLSEDELIKKRDDLKERLLNSDIKISTFDSFFSTILKSFALNFGINPNYEIENNDASLRQIIDKEFIKKIAKNQIFLDEISSFIVNTKSSSYDFLNSLNELSSEIGKVKIDGLDTANENLENLKENINKKIDDFKHIKSQIKKYCDDIINNASPKGSTKTALKEHNSTINQAQNLKNQINKPIYEVVKNDLIRRETLNYRTYSKIYTEHLGVLWDDLRKSLKEFLNELEKYKITVFFKILNLYLQVKDDINVRLNKLSFNDLSTKIYELISQKDILNMIYFRLDARVEHILIDEFQDTNVMQYQILFPLIEEIVSGLGQSGIGSFFYVGDIKQSIYRFRGGKKELFEKLMSDFKQIKKSELDRNYRSEKALVKFVNSIFKKPFDEVLGYKDQIPSKSYNKEERKNIKILKPENFDIFDVENDDYGYIKVLSSDDVLESAVSEVKNLLNKGVKEENIAILCWKNDNIDTLKSLLKQEKIEANGIGNQNLFSIPKIRAILEYAKFCITNEEIYKFNTEELLGIEVKKLNLNLQKSTTQNILYLLKKLGINADNANILHFIEESKNYENIIEFAFNKDEKNISSSDSFGVNLLTVFKSKGLQFNHVILCDKFQKDRNDISNFIKEYDVENSKWQIKYRVKNREYLDEDYKNFIQKSKNLDKEEDLNKLYVAFTRAKNSFILIKSNNSNSYFGDNKLLDIKDFEFGEVMDYELDKNKDAKKEEKSINLVKIKPQKVVAIKKETIPNIHSVKFGLAFHYALEMSDFNIKNLDIALTKSKNKFAKYLKENDFEDIKNRLKKLFLEKNFINIVKDAEILKEQPFKTRGEIKQIDLLAIKNSEIYIVDYKSAVGFEEENKIQVLEYKEIVSNFYKNKNVKAFIFYILKDKISLLEV